MKYRAILIPGVTALIGLTQITSAKIAITHYQYPSHGPAVKALVEAKAKEFERLHPNIDIKFQMGSGDPKVYMEKLLVMVVGGKAPDVLELYPGIAAPFLRSGQILDLRALVKSDRDFKLDKYLKLAVRSFTWENELWGIPVTSGAIATIYNIDMFSQAGLPDPNKLKENKNWTWDSFIDCAKKLTKDKNGDKKIDQWGVNAWADLYRFCIWPNQCGGQLFNKEIEPTSSHFVSAAARKGLEWYTSWWTKHNIVGGDFFSGKNNAAMFTQSGPWDVMNIALNKTLKNKLRWDVVSQPKGPDNDGTIAVFNGFQITKNCKKKNEAWAWLKFLTETDMQKDWVRATGRTPVLASLTKDYEEIAQNPPPHVRTYMDELSNPNSHILYDSSYNDLRQVAGDEITKVINKKTSLEQALSSLDKTYTINFKRVLKLK